MTDTAIKPFPATTPDGWSQQLAQLRSRYKHVRPPILVALNLLVYDPNISLDDAKAQANLHGVRITAASVNAVHLASLSRGGSRQPLVILTAFDGEDVAEFESSPDGHAPQRAPDMILRDASDGKSPLGGDDCELLGDDVAEAIARVVVDSREHAGERDGPFEVRRRERAA